MLSRVLKFPSYVCSNLTPSNHTRLSFRNLLLTRTMSANPYSDPEIRDFLSKVHDMMVDEALRDGIDGEKVVEFQQPEKLKEILQLQISKEPADKEQLLEHCHRIIKYSVKTASHRFFNQQYTGVNPYSLAGAWLSDALNTNEHTYEVCPVFILMEKYIMQKMCDLVGYVKGDGIMCPGGSFSNMLANHLSRFKRYPDVKKTGMMGLPQMKLFTSIEAHYSLLKSSSLLGFGSDNLVYVDTDERGKMRVDDFEQKVKTTLKTGQVPLFVMAASGTTVLGAFDDLNAIADVCEKYGVWMHVDACWGGGVLLSDTHRHLVSGIGRAQSVAWNLHKMSGINLQCSVLLVQEKGLLENCNRTHAEYLFQQDKNYDISYDMGDKTVQCGRKVDVMKLWLTWMALGDVGMGNNVDNAFQNARYFTEKIKNTKGFKLVAVEYECVNICFWYIPPSLRDQEETPEWWQKVSRVAPKIKEKMMAEGCMLIGYTPLSNKGFVNFFRIIIVNPLLDHAKLDQVVFDIDRLGKDL